MRGRALISVLVVVAWLAVVGAARGNSITPMCTTLQGQEQPCSSGWYGQPVTMLSWTWSPLAGGVPSNCGEGAYYTDSIDTVSCTVDWGVFSSTASYVIHVETSSPTAVAAPTRPPDSHGWYNHPVAVGFVGSSFSGIAFCTSSTYAGPNSAAATVTGTCTDDAGKTATASLTLHYDAARPALRITADPGDQTVGIRWQSASDVAPISSVEIARAPGLRGRRRSVLFRGAAAAFRDSRLRDGIRYRYTVTARDQAGNVSSRSLVVIPGPRLLAPSDGAKLTAPPLLRWTPVRAAKYYNLQLYRGRKLLSAWPSRATLQLRRSWRFEGHRYRLRPGRYRWFVWPGYGRRAAARYGPPIGSGTFVISR